MNMLRKIFFTLILLSVYSNHYAQVLNIGPDRIIPTCLNNNDTIFATFSGSLSSTTAYSVSQIAYNPYPFVGTNVLSVASNFNGILDDEWSNAISMPFNFCFFNNSYSQCLISQNGQIGFDLSNANTGNNWSLAGIVLPSNNPDINNTIMGAYYDLYPYVSSGPAVSSISYAVYGTAPNRVFVASWNSNPMFSCTSSYGTQQICLYETTNIIEINIQNKLSCPTWNSDLAIEGIQNANATAAYWVPGRNATAWTASNDSWRFTPNGANIDWYDDANNYLGSGMFYVPPANYVLPGQTRYIYAVANSFSCGATGGTTYTDTIFITKQLPITININQVIDANCFDESNGAISFNVTGGSNTFSYTINGNATNTNPAGLHAGNYTIVATDAYGCTSSTNVQVNEPPLLDVTAFFKEDVLCKYQNNGKIHLGATGGTSPYTFIADGIPQHADGKFDSLYAGNYRFYTIDSHGCRDSVEILIGQPDSLLHVDLTPHEATCMNKQDGWLEATASGGVPGYQYEWEDHPTEFSYQLLNIPAGVYHVLVTDANGCITATQVPVNQQLCCNIFIPDAFTPNGDGLNDVIKIKQAGGGVILGEFRIYNKWGQEIFSTRDINQGWNGSFLGKEQSADTFYYIVTYQCNDLGTISQKIAKGSFILIR